MDNIKIKATLKAYTRGLLPTKVSELENDLHFISDVDKPGLYVRKQGEWVDASDALEEVKLITPQNSGLNIEVIKPGTEFELSIRKKELTQTQFEESPDYNNLEEDTTYYILDQTADVYINGGTAFSDGKIDSDYSLFSIFNEALNGGKANSDNPNSEYAFTSYIKPLNSQGVYNG